MRDIGARGRPRGGSWSRAHLLVGVGATLGVLAATAGSAAPASAEVPVTSSAALATAFSAGGTSTVVLGADIDDVASSLLQGEFSTLQLDLHGHALDVERIVVGPQSTLTITDSTAAGGTLRVHPLYDQQQAAGIEVDAGTTLRITGTAHVIAPNADRAAGIGSSNEGPAAGAITIDGSAVVVAGDTDRTAGDTNEGEFGAGIGGGGGSVTIGGDANVTAVGGLQAAGIGDDFEATEPTDVDIAGSAQVTAYGGPGGAGIGAAYYTAAQENPPASSATIHLGGTATVDAFGGVYGAGIGGGEASVEQLDVRIDGSAVVRATGGTRAAGIGGGWTDQSSGLDVTVADQAAITASGGTGGSAIGAGDQPAQDDFGSLHITGGTVTIPIGATLTIPDGTTVPNAGTIIDAGTIAGGTIDNTGTIVSTGSLSSRITTHDYVVTFDPVGGALAGAGMETVDARTLGDAKLTLPSATSTDAADGFAGWYTGTGGTGQRLTADTDLTALLGSSDGTPLAVTVHAFFAPLPTLSGTVTASAALGGSFTGSVAGSRAAGETYAITDGQLPPGLALDPTTGTIAGTPTEAGVYLFTVTATTAAGSVSHAFAIAVAAAQPGAAPVLPDEPTAHGIARVFFSTSVAAVSSSPTTYAVSRGSLPRGLHLATTTGVISGTPRHAGSARFTIRATNAAGSARHAYSIVIRHR